MLVRGCGPGAAVLAAAVAGFVLAAAPAARAQEPPPPPAAPAPPPRSITGFVPSYEIMRTVRAAGLRPLEPPLREGRTYVLRATDYRGILMHVVLDARTGAIRDVTRIVGPGGMVPPGGPGPYGPAPYGAPAAAMPYGPHGYDRGLDGADRPPGMATTLRGPAVTARAHVPLPRPRPQAASPQPVSVAKPAAIAAPAAPAATGADKSVLVPPLND